MPMLTGSPLAPDPGMLQAMLTDPRTTPQQRAAAVAQLQALSGGQQGGGQGGAMPAAGSAPSDNESPSDWLGAGAAAAGPGKSDDAAPTIQGGTGDLANWHGDFMKMIKRQVEADSSSGEVTPEDKGLALAQAGFGMAASGSPHFGTAIGEGAVYGIGALQKLKQQRAQERMRRDAMVQAGLLHGEQVDLSQQQRAETERHNRETESTALQTAQDRAAQAKENADIKRGQLQAAADAKDAADTAKADRAYTMADLKRREDFNKTGQWTKILGDDERGITGAPDGGEYEGPLITSPKISPKAKQALELAKPKTTQATTLVVDQLGDMASKVDALLKHPGLEKATGLGGTMMSRVPGTDAANFQADLESLKSGAFVNNLNAMRQASSTGGAVGNVTEREGDRMASLQASLDQAQSPSQIKTALETIRDYAKRTGNTVKKSYVETYGDKDAPELPWEKANPDGTAADADKKPSDTVTYSTADDVRAAFKAGKLSRADAKKILQTQFGHE